MAHKTKVNGTAYEITGGKTKVNGTAYDISGGKTKVGGTAYSIKFSSLPPVGTPLENFSWEQIDIISRSGQADTYWNVGDTKSVSIVGVTYTLVIKGFAHDDLSDGSGKAGITFGLKDCLNTTDFMNGSDTDSGGWNGCALRSTLQYIIYYQLPADLRAVIKTVNKKTSAGNDSTSIQTAADTLFLFSEIEVFGSTTYSARGEGSCYAYFSTSSNRVKKRNGSRANWWLRSPAPYTGGCFCYVFDGYDSDFDSASLYYGVAFGFCV